MAVEDVNQLRSLPVRPEIQARHAPSQGASLALMCFYNLRLYPLQHLVKLEGRVYVPDSEIASQALDKHRLNAGIAREFETFPFVFLRASAYEPTSKFLVVEI